jgi:hypothetical protein
MKNSSTDQFFGLRVIGYQMPLSCFFEKDTEAKSMRMCFKDHSPAVLEVVRITVEPLLSDAKTASQSEL